MRQRGTQLHTGDNVQTLPPSLRDLVPGLPPLSPLAPSFAAEDASALHRTLAELARRPGPWQRSVNETAEEEEEEEEEEEVRTRAVI